MLNVVNNIIHVDNKINNIGPSTVPYGTPDITATKSDKTLSMVTRW